MESENHPELINLYINHAHHTLCPDTTMQQTGFFATNVHRFNTTYRRSAITDVQTAFQEDAARTTTKKLLSAIFTPNLNEEDALHFSYAGKNVTCSYNRLNVKDTDDRSKNVIASFEAWIKSQVKFNIVIVDGPIPMDIHGAPGPIAADALAAGGADIALLVANAVKAAEEKLKHAASVAESATQAKHAQELADANADSQAKLDRKTSELKFEKEKCQRLVEMTNEAVTTAENERLRSVEAVTTIQLQAEESLRAKVAAEAQAKKSAQLQAEETLKAQLAASAAEEQDEEAKKRALAQESMIKTLRDRLTNVKLANPLPKEEDQKISPAKVDSPTPKGEAKLPSAPTNPFPESGGKKKKRSDSDDEEEGAYVPIARVARDRPVERGVAPTDRRVRAKPSLLSTLNQAAFSVVTLNQAAFSVVKAVVQSISGTSDEH